MARLNPLLDCDDDLPELSTLFAKTTVSDQLMPSGHTKPSRNDSPSKHSIANRKLEKGHRCTDTGMKTQQRSLKLMHVDSLLLPLAPFDGASFKKGLQPGSQINSSPRKAISSSAKRGKVLPRDSDASDYEDASSDHMSDFIVPDSESDDSSEDLASPFVPPANSKRPISYTRSTPITRFSLPKGVQVKHSERSSDSPSKEGLVSGGTQGERVTDRKTGGGLTLRDHEDGFRGPHSILKLLGPSS